MHVQFVVVVGMGIDSGRSGRKLLFTATFTFEMFAKVKRLRLLPSLPEHPCTSARL